jgi:hypothetical protein
MNEPYPATVCFPTLKTARKIITVNGTDTFDAGTINIIYE